MPLGLVGHMRLNAVYIAKGAEQFPHLEGVGKEAAQFIGRRIGLPLGQISVLCLR